MPIPSSFMGWRGRRRGPGPRQDSQSKGKEGTVEYAKETVQNATSFPLGSNMTQAAVVGDGQQNRLNLFVAELLVAELLHLFVAGVHYVAFCSSVEATRAVTHFYPQESVIMESSFSHCEGA
jgi:hypothetical protein